MTRRSLIPVLMALALAITSLPAAAQQAHYHGVKLHINTKWDQCSFQLDPALTQTAWHQFAEEAGLVTYFRPVSDARPMGKGKWEVAMLQWQTGIDDTDAAWNDTFVHPDSTHWLFDGSRLAFPGLMVRTGVGSRTDVGLYLTKNPGANYGFYGAQVQQALVGDVDSDWAASTRFSFVSMYGPDDLDFSVIGLDLVGSRRIVLSNWATLSPYAGVSSYMTRAHEKSPLVNLDDEYVGGSHATVGAALELSVMRLGVEYSAAKVNSLSLKIGFGR